MNSQWGMRAPLAPAGVASEVLLQALEGILSLPAGTDAGGWRTAWPTQALRISCLLAGLLAAIVAMLAFVFAAWSLTAGLNWTSAFPWTTGPFSHWLTWCAIGTPLRVAASRLGRCGKMALG